MTLIVATFIAKAWALDDELFDDGIILGHISVGDLITIVKVPKYTSWVTCFTKFGICNIHEVHFRNNRGIFKHIEP